MKFSALVALTALPMALAAPLGLKPTPVRRSVAVAQATAESASEDSASVESASVDTAVLAKATDSILYSTLDSNLEAVTQLGSLIQGEPSVQTTFSVGADGATTVILIEQATATQFSSIQTPVLVSAQLNSAFQNQFLLDSFNQIFGNDVFNNNDINDILAQLAQLLTIQFNSLSAFGGQGFNNINVNDFQNFFDSFFNNVFSLDNVNANDLAVLLQVLQGLNLDQLVNLFGKQNVLFSNDFLSSNNINDFGFFANNLDDILNLQGLNGANLDANDLFNLLQVVQLLQLGQLNLNQFNGFSLFNNFGVSLNDLVNSLNLNNVNNFNNNNFNNNNLFNNNDLVNLLGNGFNNNNNFNDLFSNNNNLGNGLFVIN